MIRVLKRLGTTAVVVGCIWFVVSCGTTLSGDMCGSGKMKPGDVCVSVNSGDTTTYDEMVAAKERGPRHMKIGAAIFAAGVVLNIAGGVIALRAEPEPQQPKA
ncbi:hypothetical protein E1263_29635 [Kribbella antibiotica]|uniref:Uncharacterized protein n=1 Tax=Kribbella antibiotica TaxID=190195 RepID=A0A4R4Z1M3_9ACTN|nr:hypothetical protein [Kribbella antibiotica]TDD51861.1 hypothetical protein E1263_29635 [Kribbella antibiotica]